MNNRKLIPLEAENEGELFNERTAGRPAAAATEFRDPAVVALGRYVRAARLNLGLSYDDLSRRAGLDRVSIMALECGLLALNRPWRATVPRLARALGEDPADLELLLGIPLPPQPGEAAASGLAYAYLDVDPGDHALPRDARPADGRIADTSSCSYLGPGLLISRDRFRAARSPRDPERLYFDK